MFANVAERRNWVRYTCELQGKCRPVSALETGNDWPIHSADLSAGGIALCLCRRFEPGTLLAMSLAGSAADPIRMVLARVQRVIRTGNLWVLGCAWTDELGATELRSLLGTPSRWQRTPVNGCKVLKLESRPGSSDREGGQRRTPPTAPPNQS